MLKVLLTLKKVKIKIRTPFDRFEEGAAKFCFFLTQIWAPTLYFMEADRQR
jgi:hypothetical protein